MFPIFFPHCEAQTDFRSLLTESGTASSACPLHSIALQSPVLALDLFSSFCFCSLVPLVLRCGKKDDFFGGAS